MRLYVRMARATRRASILYPAAVTRTRPGSHGVAGRGSQVCDPVRPRNPGRRGRRPEGAASGIEPGRGQRDRRISDH